MAVPPHTPFVLFAAIVASCVGIFAWFFRDTPGARPLAVFMIAAGVWALAEGLALATPTPAGKVRWTRVVWSVSPVVPLAWLATVLAYASEDRWLTRRRLALLSVEPAALVALVWTNSRHHLVWRRFSESVADGYVVLSGEPGLAFWAHVGYSYAVVAVGAAVLVALNFRTNSHFRSQATALLVAVCVPMFANAVSVFELVPPEFDLTSIGFVVTGLVVAGAMFRGSLLSVRPATRELGRETLVDELSDPVITVDGENRVVDRNPAAGRLLGVETESVVGDPLEAVDPDLADAVGSARRAQREFALETAAGRRHFDVRVSPLDRSVGTEDGRVVSLRDVTERQRREQRLDVLNRLLRHNLRNELNVVGGNAQLLRERVAVTPSVEKRLDRISETVETIVQRSEKVGHVSRELERDDPEPVALEPVVRDVVSTVRSAHPDAAVSVDVPGAVLVTGGRTLKLAVEELLRNAIEHSDQEEPAVEVRVTGGDDGYVELRVADDGPGIEEQERRVIENGRETPLEHGSGVGLWLVAWVVREYGGTVEFADADDGCTVVVRLPEATREQSSATPAGSPRSE